MKYAIDEEDLNILLIPFKYTARGSPSKRGLDIEARTKLNPIADPCRSCKESFDSAVLTRILKWANEHREKGFEYDTVPYLDLTSLLFDIHRELFFKRCNSENSGCKEKSTVPPCCGYVDIKHCTTRETD